MKYIVLTWPHVFTVVLHISSPTRTARSTMLPLIWRANDLIPPLTSSQAVFMCSNMSPNSPCMVFVKPISSVLRDTAASRVRGVEEAVVFEMIAFIAAGIC